MVRLVMCGIVALALGGCFPGGSGWVCESSRDCNEATSCRDFGGGSYCVEPGTTSISSKSTYGWVGMIGMWGVGLLILGGITTGIVEKRNGGRNAKIIAIAGVAVVYLGVGIAYHMLAGNRRSASTSMFLQRYQDLRDKTCACPDLGCVTKLTADQATLARELGADSMKRAELAEVERLADEIVKCTAKLTQ